MQRIFQGLLLSHHLAEQQLPIQMPNHPPVHTLTAQALGGGPARPLSVLRGPGLRAQG